MFKSNEYIPCYGSECTKFGVNRESSFRHLTFKVTVNYIYVDDPRRRQHSAGPVGTQQGHPRLVLDCFAGAASRAMNQIKNGPRVVGPAKIDIKLGDFELSVGDDAQPGHWIAPGLLRSPTMVPVHVMEKVNKANEALAGRNPVPGCGYQSQLTTTGEVVVLLWVERRR
ncbi:hypothetical protein ASPCAL09509 [Aspergillus calidoustus]|uniref:Uncharacterized protein n=1 Tax=Aspergillus calidoustus TaxID=454130 RepID=A0A0U5CRZ9_ASPCI|nr:hypothetical protein ASPCAL09509 [Aspergillus calidoustus]